MLKAEPTREYYVYPSWAELPYRWEDLAHILADPLNSAYLDVNDLTHIREGVLSASAQPIRLIRGPQGGGIIVGPRIPDPQNPFAEARHDRWLGGVLLGKDVDILVPRGTLATPQHSAFVVYLEPRDDPMLRLTGIAKRPKLYVPSASIEHAQCAGENVYWFVDFLAGRQEIKGLQELPRWAEDFGFRAKRLDGMPNALRQETASWFSDPSSRFAWFQIESESTRAGYHFAVMLYVALHLRRVAGQRMRSMHLVADIEGKPNARPKWSRK